MDLKGVGYLISTVSVLLLGVVAWSVPHDPQWHASVSALGMATAIGGMAVRYVAHLRQRRQLTSQQRERRSGVVAPPVRSTS
jgi:protein-S-isoprenylcysteine O-methyltransferase Ste14